MALITCSIFSHVSIRRFWLLRAVRWLMMRDRAGVTVREVLKLFWIYGYRFGWCDEVFKFPLGGTRAKWLGGPLSQPGRRTEHLPAAVGLLLYWLSYLNSLLVSVVNGYFKWLQNSVFYITWMIISKAAKSAITLRKHNPVPGLTVSRFHLALRVRTSRNRSLCKLFSFSRGFKHRIVCSVRLILIDIRVSTEYVFRSFFLRNCYHSTFIFIIRHKYWPQNFVMKESQLMSFSECKKPL
jgi:hypothetical protein